MKTKINLLPLMILALALILINPIAQALPAFVNFNMPNPVTDLGIRNAGYQNGTPIICPDNGGAIWFGSVTVQPQLPNGATSSTVPGLVWSLTGVAATQCIPGVSISNLLHATVRNYDPDSGQIDYFAVGNAQSVFSMIADPGQLTGSQFELSNNTFSFVNCSRPNSQSQQIQCCYSSSSTDPNTDCP